MTRFVALRLELTDRFFASRVTTVNGCTAADLQAMDLDLRSGGAGAVSPSANCDAASFGVNPTTGRFTLTGGRSADIALASNLVKPPYQSSVVHQPSVSLGLSVQF